MPFPRFLGLRAAARAAVFLLKLYPMLPSRALDYVTPAPIVERFHYPTSRGPAEGDFYRPSTRGPHPGLVVCLGVVPFGVDHPQVPRLGAALARSGVAALLYWSPAMRDYRLDPADVADIASAYERLISRPSIDATRSGLLGACVGGAFALMAAADPRVRDRVAFVGVYAPYASMWTLAPDIASSTRSGTNGREPWQVDPLTLKVFVHSFTALLGAEESAHLRDAFEEPHCPIDPSVMSEDGRAVYRLLAAPDHVTACATLRQLPATVRGRLDALSPMRYLDNVHAPLVILMHDRDDPVIPVGESRRLWTAISRRKGSHYTEFTVFRHLDPTKGKLSPLSLAWEFGRFYCAIYPMFRHIVAQSARCTDREC